MGGEYEIYWWEGEERENSVISLLFQDFATLEQSQVKEVAKSIFAKSKKKFIPCPSQF